MLPHIQQICPKPTLNNPQSLNPWVDPCGTGSSTVQPCRPAQQSVIFSFSSVLLVLGAADCSAGGFVTYFPIFLSSGWSWAPALILRANAWPCIPEDLPRTTYWDVGHAPHPSICRQLSWPDGWLPFMRFLPWRQQQVLQECGCSRQCFDLLLTLLVHPRMWPPLYHAQLAHTHGSPHPGTNTHPKTWQQTQPGPRCCRTPQQSPSSLLPMLIPNRPLSMH